MASGGLETILITGANGFIGFGILSKALQDGYQVRGVVRSKEAADTIKSTRTGERYLRSGALSIVQVPNLSMSGLLLEAARDCKYIIHAGSPLPSGNPGNLIFETLDGIQRILDVAQATKSIRRVVFTLSVYSLFQNDSLAANADPPKVNPSAQLPADSSNGHPCSHWNAHMRYNMAKIASKKLIEDYAASNAQQYSHFSIVNVYPAFVLGPSEIVKSKARAYAQSCGFLAYMWIDLSSFMHAYLGQPDNEQLQILACHCHVTDCSEVHIKVLDTDRVKGKLRSFLVCSDGPSGYPWELATTIVRRDLPEAVESINLLPCTFISKSLQFDCSDTERQLLGRKLIPFSQQVRDTVPWMLSLPDE